MDEGHRTYQPSSKIHISNHTKSVGGRNDIIPADIPSAISKVPTGTLPNDHPISRPWLPSRPSTARSGSNASIDSILASSVPKTGQQPSERSLTSQDTHKNPSSKPSKSRKRDSLPPLEQLHWTSKPAPPAGFKLQRVSTVIWPNTKTEVRVCHFPIRQGHEVNLAVHPLQRAFALGKAEASWFDRVSFVMAEALFITVFVLILLGYFGFTALAFVQNMLRDDYQSGLVGG